MVRKVAVARAASRLMLGASVAALAIGAAFAQQAAQEDLETVTVTGTLIKGINPVGTNSISVSAADIAATGQVTPDRILENIPQISNVFNTVPTSGTNDVGTSRGAIPQIRKLGVSGGATTTLELVNGHNMVGVGSLNTSSDFSEVPSIVLQRIDVVPDGGSSLYGSDAVTGTINFITRKSFEGFMTDVSYGTTGNYDQINLAAMAGESWGSGNAYLAYQYTYNGYQMSADRPYLRQDLIPLGGTVDGRSSPCALANVTAGTTTYALNTNTLSTTPGSIKAAASVGKNICDAYQGGTPGSVGNVQGQSIIPTEQQSTFWGEMTQHIAEGIDFSLTANYSYHTARSRNAPRTTTNAVITNANPFFQAIGTETQQTVSFDYSPVFGPYNMGPQFESQWEVVPEVDFDLGSGWYGKDWTLDVFGNYGRSDDDTVFYAVNNAAVSNALATSDPNYALDPYNLSKSSAQTLAYLQSYGQNGRGIQTIEQGQALAQGSIFSLPGGDVHLAIGARYEYYNSAGDYYNGPANNVVFPTAVAPQGGYRSTLSGHRVTESAFFELEAPIVGAANEMPLVHKLNVDVSGRHDYLSTSGGGFEGGTNNYRMGVTYSPIEGLDFRGNLGTSFIAPSLDDTVAAIDTRVAFGGSAGPNPYDTAAQQAAERLRPSLAMPGGNPNLVPQTSVSSSYGFDYHPDFLEGLDLSLTRWQVDLYHTIALPGTQSTSLIYQAGTGGNPGPVSAAFSPYYIINPTLAQVIAGTTINGVPVPQAGFSGYQQYFPANGAACPVVNAATGCTIATPYVFEDLRRFNFGQIQSRGWDFNVDYKMDTNFGSAEFGVSGSDNTWNHQINVVNVDVLAANFSPYQFTAHVGGTAGPLSARLTMFYSAGYTATGLGAQTHVSSFEPVNLNVSYDLDGLASWTGGATASLEVANLFDNNPPFANSGTGTANGATLGRMFTIDLRKKF